MLNNTSKMDTRLALERQAQGVGVRVRFKEGVHRWDRTFPRFSVDEDEVGMMHGTTPSLVGPLYIVRWSKGWGLVLGKNLELVEETV